MKKQLQNSNSPTARNRSHHSSRTNRQVVSAINDHENLMLIETSTSYLDAADLKASRLGDKHSGYLTFLNKQELEMLIGSKRRAKQCAWLRSNGLRFWLNSANIVIVPRSAIDGLPVSAEPSPVWQPNALKKVA